MRPIMSKKRERDKAPKFRFPLHTSQEMDALERAAAEGKYGKHWDEDVHGRYLQHDVPGIPHIVRMELTPDEREAGLTLEMLTDLQKGQDSDAALAILCIAGKLAPPTLQGWESARGEIALDDVIEMIGWEPRSTEERRAQHRRIYQFILFGERAQVMGQRKGTYIDKHTGESIETEIDAPLWRIHQRERPSQPSLFPEGEIPISVELVVSRPWAMLLTLPQTAQYLPMGELLGSIRGGQPSGAWARVIGLALASFWRRNPKEVLSGQMLPTRRELLERYPPKTGQVSDLLAGNNPAWAIKYWIAALSILAKVGFIRQAGEALKTEAAIKRDLPRFDWADLWLDAEVHIEPGDFMQAAMTTRAAAIDQGQTRRRGRPKKNEP